MERTREEDDKIGRLMVEDMFKYSDELIKKGFTYSDIVRGFLCSSAMLGKHVYKDYKTTLKSMIDNMPEVECQDII